MAYVTIPKDLNAVKTKVMFNLTKRQLTFFTLGGAVGLPVFFLLKDSVDTTIATLVMMITMLPFFMFAMYEKHGQPLEILLKQMYMVKFGTAKERPYKTENFYELLEKQYDLNREVISIVKKSKKNKANKSRKKRGRRDISKT